MRRDTAPAWTLPLLILLCVLGTAIGMMLTSYHLSQGKPPLAVFQTVCGADGGGCREVLQSPWAVLPGGIPVAALGVAYFGGLGLWYLIVGLANRRGRIWQAVPFAIHILGALASLYLFGVMLSQVGAICWWCTFSHLINFALLFTAWKAWPRDDGYSNESARPSPRLALAGLLLMLAVAAVTVQRVAVQRMQGTVAQASEYVRTFQEDADLQRYLHMRQDPQRVAVRPNDPVRGTVGAPHTVVVFSDFQCPGCRGFAEFSERELLPRFGSRLRLIYKHFPLEGECNPAVTGTVHPQACEAAFAAEAARELGGNEAFWRMHDLLFARQAGLAESPWIELGGQVGIDGAAVADRVARRGAQGRVRQDAELGRAVEIGQTPTVFLDGRPVNDWSRLDVWQALLREEPRVPAVVVPEPAAGFPEQEPEPVAPPPAP